MSKLKFITNSNREITFNFVNNIIGDTMASLIKESKGEVHIAHGSFNMLIDKDEVERELLKTVADLVSAGIDMPTVPANMDRNTLNRIHEDFHVIEEAEQAKTNKTVNWSVRKLLTEVNFLVHKLESAMYGNKEEAMQVMYIGDKKVDNCITPHRQRIILNNELRKFFRIEAFPARVTLSCGYSTIGKNFAHAVHDNDVELVKNGNIRPQLSISTETVWSYHTLHNVATNELDHIKISERRQEWHDKHTLAFVKNNNLQDYVGYKDPIHYFGTPAVYAYAADDTIDIIDWHNILTVDKIKIVEVE